MFFVDKLIGMGARIVLCDPHRALVAGPSPLRGSTLESPDIRAGMAMLLAALCADGHEHDQQRGADRARLRAHRRASARARRADHTRRGPAELTPSDVATLERPDRESVPELEPFGVTALHDHARGGELRHAHRRAGAPGDGAVGPASRLAADAVRLVAAALRHRIAGARHSRGASTMAYGRDGFASNEADGHFASRRGTAMAVTIADCVPIFIAHPRRRDRAPAFRMARHGSAHHRSRRSPHSAAQSFRAADLRVHLGPAICGACYEVSAEVATALTGRSASRSGAHRPARVDHRARARRRRVERSPTSALHACDNAASSRTAPATWSASSR